jgi:hypothetical protein
MAAWLQQYVSTVDDGGKGNWGDSGGSGMPHGHTEGHTLLVSGHQNGGRTVKSGLQEVQGRTRRGAALRSEPAAVPLAMMAWVARPVVEDELGTRILRELARTGLDLPGYSQ